MTLHIDYWTFVQNGAALPRLTMTNGKIRLFG